MRFKVNRTYVAGTAALASVALATTPAWASIGTLTAPTMPDATSTINTFGGIFSDGGTIALFVIGGAVALGAIVIVAKYGWSNVRTWLNRSK